ncbi:MAG: right-handed parallel beta-helix repeat-containing protein, partial [bacterium]
MMKENSFSLCSYTPTHVGWGVNSPCAPPEPSLLPTPAVTSVSPAQGSHGLDATVSVDGSNFFPGAKLDIGSDVFVHTTELVGDSILIADVTILADAPPGIRDVKIRNRDGQIAALPAAFEVVATTRHYFSPTGGNNYPFIDPPDAATSLADVIAATYDGDTLFVPTMTFDGFSLSTDRGVLLYGGWNSDFTVRDLESGKTILDLSGNMTFFDAGVGAGLDGFVIQNGSGAADVVPYYGYYGGAVRFVGGSAIVANCEVHSNNAGTSMDYGLGGAIYARNCAVLIRDAYFHDNSATQGGALYLDGCSGVVAGNTISGNSVTGVSEPPLGAGVLVLDSPGIEFSGNTFSGNTGAQEGGGLYVDGVAALTMTDDYFDGNTATLSGGGARIKNTAATVSGLVASSNSCTGIGGGMAVELSDVTITGGIFASNTAAAGGGIYSASGDCAVDHNLFIANNASGTGGAMLLSALAAGRVAGNTLDANISGSVGGISAANSSIDVFDNIVVNSTGVGISCSGAALPTLTYNLVWNNSGGGYAGCAPGEGSLTGDPIFLDPASGDYHLGLNSPAIDSGRPGTAFEDPDGSRGDMGIYGSHDFVMDQPTYPKNLDAAVDGGNVVLSWTRNPEPDVVNYAVYCDVGEGFIPSPSNFVTLVPGADSTVTVSLPVDTTYYRISAVDSDGYAGGYSDPVSTSQATGIGDRIVRHRFVLEQNSPNPFNPSTRIHFELPSRVDITLTVFDVDGRLVKTLVNETKGPGEFSATWDGRNDNGEYVASGVYFYRLRAGTRIQTKK